MQTNYRWEATKLNELRAKTDRELVALINRRLDFALAMDSAIGDGIYQEVTRLLQVAYGATTAERARIRSKLALLAETSQSACVA
jgi:hypothetical protein